MTTVSVQLPDGFGAVDVASALLAAHIVDAVVDGTPAADVETTIDVDGVKLHITLDPVTGAVQFETLRGES